MRLTLPGTTVLATSIVLIGLCHSVVLAQEGPGLSETPQTRAAVEEPPPSIDYQTQIYIVSGTLGGILLLLIILVLALALSVAKLKDQLEKRQKSYLVDDNNINHNPDAAGLGRDQIHAYDNSAFTGVGDATEMQERSVDAKMEIARRGYTVYNGNSHENSYADPADLRFEHENRLEMKVPAKNPAESSHDECDEASDPHADLSSREQRWLSRAQAAHNMSTRRNKHSSLLCCMALKSLDRRITP